MLAEFLKVNCNRGKTGYVINRDLGNMQHRPVMRLADWNMYVLRRTWSLWMK